MPHCSICPKKLQIILTLFIAFSHTEDGKNRRTSKLICLSESVTRREKVEFGFKRYAMYNEALRKVNALYYGSQ